MQHKLLLILSFITTTLSAQNPSGLTWDYGLNANFNVAFIKPSASDSFTNKSGFGAGLMLEASKNMWSVQLSPNYTNTSYINDKTLGVTTINSLDFSFDFLYTPKIGSAIYFVGGLTPGFTFTHVEKKLDGSKNSGLSVKTVDGVKRFDLAYKLGVALDLNEGWRFVANYYDFLNGTQKNGKIKGRIDYLQFGVQVRFNSLLNGAEVTTKNEELNASTQISSAHLEALKNGATMVFVLPRIGNPRKSIEAQMAEKQGIWEEVRKAIQAQYKGTFIVIEPDQMDSLVAHKSVMAVQTDGSKTALRLEKPYYISNIGEFFVGNNTNLSWGIMVLDSEMDVLKEPFPFYIPYRNVDKVFKNTESVARMVYELNQAIQAP